MRTSVSYFKCLHHFMTMFAQPFKICWSHS